MSAAPRPGSRPLVAMISKPVVPPWNDSAKNIVKDQARYAARYDYRLLTTRDTALASDRVTCCPIYPSGGTFAAGIWQNLRVMLHGLRPGGAALYHYFFAPNPKTALAGRLQTRLAGVPSVQTVCSRPASFAHSARLLFTDRVIVLSEDTRQGFVDAGIDPARIVHIRPGIAPIDPPTPAQRRERRHAFGFNDGPLVIFPGDYEFSTAARTVAAAAPNLLEACPGVTLVFACRIKRPASAAIQADIQRRLAPLGQRVRYINQVDDMPAFVGMADVVIMPAESLYAKMDVPLVLLEAMSQQVPVVLATSAPLSELLHFQPGLGVPPQNPRALTQAITDLLRQSEAAAQYGENGRRAVLTHFNDRAMAQQVEAVYDELLAARGHDPQSRNPKDAP
ncbi:MAG: glycosyltransferase family 4 protein [Myxococcales bacterium]|nr:glycosyltransferase family 4 protein [Myxococcales bacterium]